MLQIACPSCTKLLNVPDEARGRQAKCPSCASVFSVPDADATPVSAGPLPLPPPPADPAAAFRREEDDPFDDRPRPRRRERGVSLDRFEDDGAAVYWGRRASRGAAVLLYVAFSFGALFFLLTLFSLIGAGGRTHDAMAATFLCTLVVFLPQFAFVPVGGIFLSLVRVRGMALAGAIVAVTAGGLLLLASFVLLIGLAEDPRRGPDMLWVQLLAAVLTAVLNLVAGIRGLVVLARPDVKDAFLAGTGARGRPYGY